MKIKTIQDLDNLIQDNDGKLVIGSIVFERNDNDIDVRVNDSLVMWFSFSNTDLTEFSVTGLFSKKQDLVKEELKKVQLENENLVVEVANLNSKIKESGKLAGKVEAYEKLLMHRELTVGK